MSHDRSHDRRGKEVHRPCSRKSNGNSIEFFLSNTDKRAVGLIPALELASLTVEKQFWRNVGEGKEDRAAANNRARRKDLRQVCAGV